MALSALIACGCSGGIAGSWGLLCSAAFPLLQHVESPCSGRIKSACVKFGSLSELMALDQAEEP